jgi:hypothetical protein
MTRGPWWFPGRVVAVSRSPTGDEGADRADEAAAWLRWLDHLVAVSAADDHLGSYRGWAPNWSEAEEAAHFALTHLRRQARSLAVACAPAPCPDRRLLHDLPGQLPVIAFLAGFARAWRRLPDSFRSLGRK